ncbi:hypothetical protein [Streptomyces sp. NPDC001604]|uniref:hypothetical protein n=1 Tax=Streptomyces sp. NPDC001604 TaxID=3364593 RepID=UPI0036BFC01D
MDPAVTRKKRRRGLAGAPGAHQHLGFLFPQMQQEGIAPEDWEPQYMDQLYAALTNATAFSPRRHLNVLK